MINRPLHPTLNQIYLFAIPLLFSIGIATLFYPGFMSYDTLHALHGARHGVTDSEWPPMVSYVWRAVDLVSHNPSAMHFSQVFLLLFSISFIVFLFTKKILNSVLFLILYLSVPVILGTIAVIWKDVLMAAFFLGGFSIIMTMRHVQSKKAFLFLLLLAILFLFTGVCSRHNAMAGAIPLIFYLAFVISLRAVTKPLYLISSVIILGTVLSGTIFFTKTQLDHYSLPDLVKMKNSTGTFIESVRILDIAGASLCLNNNFFSTITPDLSLAEIRTLYVPKHMNLSLGLLSRVGYSAASKDSRIDKIWWGLAVHHPFCFFYNKLQLTKYLIGANNGEQFLITSPSVENNEYGYKLSDSPLRNSVVSYIIQASKLTFFKPWFLYLLSVGSVIYMIQARAITLEIAVILLSAILYFIGLVLFGNAADARLPFYTTTALFMLTFFSFLDIKKHQLANIRSWFKAKRH